MKHETMERLRSISYALQHNIPLSLFDDNYEYSADHMFYILEGIKDKLDVTPLLNPSIPRKKMYYAYNALKFGTNIDTVLNADDEKFVESIVADAERNYYINKIKEANPNVDLSVFEKTSEEDEDSFLSSATIIGVGKLLVDKNINITHYISEGFNIGQLFEIMNAYYYCDIAIDLIEKYAKHEFNRNQMGIIFMHLDSDCLTHEEVEEFAKPEFDANTMDIIASAMVHGVYNDTFKEYLKKYLELDKDIPGDDWDNASHKE